MELILGKMEMLDLGKDNDGINITCNEGQLWLTQTGDSRDHLLRAGGNFIVRTRGQLIITALEPCHFAMSRSNESGQLNDSAKVLGRFFQKCCPISL